MSNDHETMVERATRGDGVAIDSLLERHLAGLQAFIRLRCGKAIRERESCSDLAQSVCREMLQAMDRFEYRGETAFRHWLFTKALRKIQDRGRYYLAQKRDVRREVRKSSSSDERASLVTEYGACFTTPSQVAMGDEMLERIEQAFDQLPDNYREVVTLSRMVGLSNQEIAAELNCTESSVHNALYRGLRRLVWIMGVRGKASEG